MTTTSQRRRVVVFDLETTVRARRVIEFGAVEIDLRTMSRVSSLRLDVGGPEVSPLVDSLSESINHFTSDRVARAPPFSSLADQIHKFLEGAVWAGHNILSFDVPALRSEFALIGRECPRTAGAIDTLVMCREMGIKCDEGPQDLKLATLARFFGLAEETHTALEDAELCFEVLVKILARKSLSSLVQDAPMPPPPREPQKHAPAPALVDLPGGTGSSDPAPAPANASVPPAPVTTTPAPAPALVSAAAREHVGSAAVCDNDGQRVIVEALEGGMVGGENGDVDVVYSFPKGVKGQKETATKKYTLRLMRWVKDTSGPKTQFFALHLDVPAGVPVIEKRFTLANVVSSVRRASAAVATLSAVSTTVAEQSVAPTMSTVVTVVGDSDCKLSAKSQDESS